MILNLAGSDWAYWFVYNCRHLSTLFEHSQHYAPWTYIFLWPIAIVPDIRYSIAILILVALYFIFRYVQDWWRMLMLVATPAVMISLSHGNIDGLLVAALMSPMWLSLIIVSCKPVLLAGWALRHWLDSGNVKQLIPITVILLISLLVWGLWPLKITISELKMSESELAASTSRLEPSTYCFSINYWWPYTAIIGAALLIFTKSNTWWLIGSAMLSPYITVYQLVPTLAYIYKRKSFPVLLVITVALWYVTILQRG